MPGAGSSLAQDILGALRRQFAGQVVPVVVHEDEVVREAASFGQPVIEYAPQSQARQDFENLADWLEDHPPQPAVEVELVRGRRIALTERRLSAEGPGRAETNGDCPLGDCPHPLLLP